jgi:hypothetical protein
VAVQFRKTYHGGTATRRKIEPSGDRVIGSSDSGHGQPDGPMIRGPPCRRAFVVDFFKLPHYPTTSRVDGAEAGLL